MKPSLRSWWQDIWWQHIEQYRIAIGVCAIVCVVVIVIIIIGYQFDWTGFNGYDKVLITHIISGTNAGTVTRTEEYQPGKGLWDWLQLLGVLAIPIVVGFGAIWFTTRQGKVADAENTDNQRETALQAYIDKMSELLLHEKLRGSAEEDEVRTIARVRTLTVLRRLDAERKVSVLQFLNESGLIDKGHSIIDLREAKLNGVNLSGANLSGANLSGAFLMRANLYAANLYAADLNGTNLYKAYLSKVKLIKATLKGANLSRSDLSGADLSGADLSGAIMISISMRPYDPFTGSFLGGVNLSRADLSEADLSEADLSGANLSASIVTPEQLAQAKSLKGATMPDGSIHD